MPTATIRKIRRAVESGQISPAAGEGMIDALRKGLKGSAQTLRRLQDLAAEPVQIMGAWVDSPDRGDRFQEFQASRLESINDCAHCGRSHVAAQGLRACDNRLEAQDFRQDRLPYVANVKRMAEPFAHVVTYRRVRVDRADGIVVTDDDHEGRPTALAMDPVSTTAGAVIRANMTPDVRHASGCACPPCRRNPRSDAPARTARTAGRRNRGKRKRGKRGKKASARYKARKWAERFGK